MEYGICADENVAIDGNILTFADESTVEIQVTLDSAMGSNGLKSQYKISIIIVKNDRPIDVQYIGSTGILSGNVVNITSEELEYSMVTELIDFSNMSDELVLTVTISGTPNAQIEILSIDVTPIGQPIMLLERKLLNAIASNSSIQIPFDKVTTAVLIEHPSIIDLLVNRRYGINVAGVNAEISVIDDKHCVINVTTMTIDTFYDYSRSYTITDGNVSLLEFVRQIDDRFNSSTDNDIPELSMYPDNLLYVKYAALRKSIGNVIVKLNEFQILNKAYSLITYQKYGKSSSLSIFQKASELTDFRQYFALLNRYYISDTYLAIRIVKDSRVYVLTIRDTV